MEMVRFYLKLWCWWQIELMALCFIIYVLLIQYTFNQLADFQQLLLFLLGSWGYVALPHFPQHCGHTRKGRMMIPLSGLQAGPLYLCSDLGHGVWPPAGWAGGRAWRMTGKKNSSPP